MNERTPEENLLRGLRDHERERAAERPLPPEVEAAAADPARRIGPYVLLEELGRGGMGVVHRAFDTSLHREVAIKRLPGTALGEEARRRFRAEASAIARFEHPGIVTIFETSEHEGAPYIVMELLHGESLEARLAREPLEPATAAALVRDVASALAHAHERGVVHRDVKPQNVFLQPDGRVRLMDFGLAREVSRAAPLTHTGEVLGSPGYLAPEQARGDPHEQGPRTDVYGLGGLLYRCLAGRPPFVADGIEALLARVILEQPAALPAGVPRDLETISLRCLAKEPERRYASAAAVREDLERFLAGRPILGRPIGPTERARLWARRNRRAVAGLLALPLVAVATALAVREDSLRAEAARRVREEAAAAERADRERREKVDSVLSATRARTDEGGVDPVSVETLAALADPKTGARLVGALDALTDALHAAKRAVFLEAKTPLPEEATAGQKELSGLEAALDRARSGPLEPADERLLAAAARRLEDRAARTPVDRTFQVPKVRTMVAAAQKAALGAGGLHVAALLRAVLERREGDEAEGALARHMFADEDEERSGRTAVALIGRKTRSGHRLVMRQFARFGTDGSFGELAKPALRVSGVKTDWPAETEPELVQRGVARLFTKDLEGAVADLGSAIALAPADTNARFWRAQARHLLKDYDEAEEDYTKALELDGRNPAIWLNRSLTRGKNGDGKGARADATKAIELDPSLGRAWMQRGSLKIEANDLKGAVADLTRATELDPRDVPTWINLGVANMNAAHYDAAIAAFTRAIDLDPEDSRPISMRGNARVTKGELEAGIADLTRALALQPKDAQGWMTRGVARSKLGHIKDALSDLTKAIELEPRYWQAYINRGCTRRFDHDSDGAIADLTKAIELAPPGHPMAWMNRGIAKLEKGDREGAIADLTRAIKLDRKHAAAWRNRGNAYIVEGKFDEAIADLTKAIELDPQDAEAWNSRGAARAEKGEADAALADANKAIELEPRDATFWANRGTAREKKGDLDGALEDVTHAIEIDARVARIWSHRSHLRRKKKDLAGALADAGRAIELAPALRELWDLRAGLREEMGDAAGAESDRAHARTLSEKP